MTNDDIRSFLERFRLAWERQDVKALVALLRRTIASCVSPIFNTLNRRSQVEKAYTDVFKAFSMQNIKLEDIVIGNDGSAKGRRRVEPATSTQSAKSSVSRVRQANRADHCLHLDAPGRADHERVNRIYDFTSLLIQLGALRAKPAHN